MANKIIQLRLGFGKEDNIKPNKNLVANKLVKELGIYGLPGTSFKINNNGTIMLNGSGLLSIGYENMPITSLILDSKSYDLINNNGHYLLIDLLYEEVVSENE